eukprot:scaffold1399_cov410-Prasinococcus_capsulatus_cf.AAC.12
MGAAALAAPAARAKFETPVAGCATCAGSPGQSGARPLSRRRWAARTSPLQEAHAGPLLLAGERDRERERVVVVARSRLPGPGGGLLRDRPQRLAHKGRARADGGVQKLLGLAPWTRPWPSALYHSGNKLRL